MNKFWMAGTVAVVAGGLMMSTGCGTTHPVAPAQEPVAPVVMPPTTPPLPPVVAPKIDEVKAPVVPVAEVGSKVYVVKSGDSLSRIAARCKVSKKDIIKLNNITNPDKIKVGQKLTLPGSAEVGAAAPAEKTAHKKTAKKSASGKTAKTAKKAAPAKKAATPAEGTPAAAVEGAAPAVAPVEAAAPAPAPKSNEVLHVVEPNQDLASIAMMYGVRTEEVMKLNSLSSPDVKVGQTLKIPPPAE